jgi:hypothetical protein
MFNHKTRFIALSIAASLSLWSAIGAAAHPVVPFGGATPDYGLTIASMPGAGEGASAAEAVSAAASSSTAAAPAQAIQSEGVDRDRRDIGQPYRYERLAPENLAPTRYNKTIDRGDGD